MCLEEASFNSTYSTLYLMVLLAALLFLFKEPYASLISQHQLGELLHLGHSRHKLHAKSLRKHILIIVSFSQKTAPKWSFFEPCHMRRTFLTNMANWTLRDTDLDLSVCKARRHRLLGKVYVPTFRHLQARQLLSRQPRSLMQPLATFTLLTSKCMAQPTGTIMNPLAATFTPVTSPALGFSAPSLSFPSLPTKSDTSRIANNGEGVDGKRNPLGPVGGGRQLQQNKTYAHVLSSNGGEKSSTVQDITRGDDHSQSQSQVNDVACPTASRSERQSTDVTPINDRAKTVTTDAGAIKNKHAVQGQGLEEYLKPTVDQAALIPDDSGEDGIMRDAQELNHTHPQHVRPVMYQPPTTPHAGWGGSVFQIPNHPGQPNPGSLFGPVAQPPYYPSMFLPPFDPAVACLGMPPMMLPYTSPMGYLHPALLYPPPVQRPDFQDLQACREQLTKSRRGHRTTGRPTSRSQGRIRPNSTDGHHLPKPPVQIATSSDSASIANGHLSPYVESRIVTERKVLPGVPGQTHSMAMSNPNYAATSYNLQNFQEDEGPRGIPPRANSKILGSLEYQLNVQPCPQVNDMKPMEKLSMLNGHYETNNQLRNGIQHRRQSRRGRTSPSTSRDLCLGSELMPDTHGRVDELESQVEGPPLNAPTGPASLRKVSNSIQGSAQSVTTCNPSETASWSQSKRWMSQETKERMAFQKMMLSLHYMGADKSPFVPQSPAELAAFRATIAEDQRHELARRINRLIEKIQPKKDKAGTAPTASSGLNVELFGGREFTDNLSPFFAVSNCFNKKDPDGSQDLVDWPSLSELKEEGDKRASRFSRYFPLPRLNVVAKRILEKEREKAYNPDGSIMWEKKAVKLGSRDVMPVLVDNRHDYSFVPEPRLQDLSLVMQDLVRGIQGGFYDEGDGTEAEKKTEVDILWRGRETGLEPRTLT